MSLRNFTYEPTEQLFDGLSTDESIQLGHIWDLCESAQQTDADPRKAQVRSAVLAQINDSAAFSSAHSVESRPARPPARIYRMRFRAVSIAAAVVLGLSMLLSPSHDQFRAPTGSELTTVSLADGSTVDLAPGSRLIVKKGFNDHHRDVALIGDGFFDVQPGTTPFEVSTFDATTTVLGTSFGISAWPGAIEASTEVLVATGRVQVHGSNGEVLLAADQMTSSDDVTIQEVDISAKLVWLSGGFSYQDELIGNVLDDVERRFDIKVKAPSSIRLRPITIHRNEVGDASEFLGDIAATISVRYRQRANGYEMYLN